MLWVLWEPLGTPRALRDSCLGSGVRAPGAPQRVLCFSHMRRMASVEEPEMLLQQSVEKTNNEGKATNVFAAARSAPQVA